MDKNLDIEKAKESIKESLSPIIKALVDKPEDVKLDVYSGHKNTIIISVTTDSVDTGKVIGRGGRHADAIRTLVSAISARFGCRSIVEI